MTTPVCSATPRTLHTFSPSLSQKGEAATPSFLGDQRNWGMSVGWSQEPRRPVSQPQALPLCPWKAAASPKEEKVGQCWSRVGVWEGDSWPLFSLPWHTLCSLRLGSVHPSSALLCHSRGIEGLG